MTTPVAKTVTQLLQASLRTIGVLAAGETADSDDLAVALEAFQDLLAELAMDNLFIPFLTWQEVPLSAGVGLYSIGWDGTYSPAVTADRPNSLYGAYVRDSSGNDFPVKIMGWKEYNDQPGGHWTTARANGKPEYLFYNPSAPNGNVLLDPWPTSTYEYLYVLYAKQFDEPIDLSKDLMDDYFIPRGYHAPLRWMLSVELCAEFGAPLTELIAARSSAGRSNIIGLNALTRSQAVELQIPGGKTGYYGTILDS